MPKIISKIDTILIIPPYMRKKFPNKEELIIEFKAEEPTEVPDYVADYYTDKKNYGGKIFRRSNEPKPPEPIKEPEPEKFDPIEWISNNYQNIEEAVKQLDWNDLRAVAKAMKMKSTGIARERLEEKIVYDVAVKEKQQEELEKNKDIEVSG